MGHILGFAAEKISFWLYTCVLVVLMLGAGLWFSFRTGFVQLRMLREAVRVTGESPKEGGVSAFGALMVSTASRVGTGNILGVAGAILTGGCGSVFWMWLIALLGAATAFAESTLAQLFRKKAPDGSFYGGPAYYIQSAMGGGKKLAAVFSVCLLFTYGVGFNMLTSYNLQSALSCYDFYVPGRSPLVISAAAAVLSLCCALGGGKALSRVTGVLVPLMSLLYMGAALAVVVIHMESLPAAFAEIFRSAFDFKAIFGGFSGSCLMMGVRRGLFSNEAGVGSAPNAAAAADVSHPVKQGLTQMLSVYIDTMLLCTATALMIVCTALPAGENTDPSLYVQEVLRANFGPMGLVFLTVSLVLFAFTTLVGNFCYIESGVTYLAGGAPGEKTLAAARLGAAVLIFLGGAMGMEAAWNTADFFMALMCLINVPVLLRLTPLVRSALEDYSRGGDTNKKNWAKAGEKLTKSKRNWFRQALTAGGNE